ncbi:MAG: hypothetical protein ABWY13_07675 [Mesorhizobium sp.]
MLLLAACGGDNGSPPVVVAPAPSPQPAPQPTPQPAPEPQPAPQPAPEPQPSPGSVTLASTYTDLIQGSQIGQPNWSDGSGTGSAIAGVNCMSNVQSHTHSHISIYREGVSLAIPASIGLRGCGYELHTHDRSGVVHVEPNVRRDLTLGQFFAVWGQPISRTAVAGLAGPVRFYVVENETLTRIDGNPADIVFGRHKQIVILTGTAPVVLPKYRWPASL